MNELINIIAVVIMLGLAGFIWAGLFAFIRFLWEEFN